MADVRRSARSRAYPAGGALGGAGRRVAALLLAAALSAPAAAGPQRRVALVIGNGHYAGAPVLVNALHDAADMCGALKELRFDTTCVTDVATRRDFKREVQAFRARLGPGVAAVFYYAGHGVQIDGENFLLPTAAQIRRKEDVEDETLGLHFVMAALDETQADFMLVVLDACRNSPFTRGFSRSAGRGLAPVADAPPGSLVLYSTAANDTASDGDPGARNSPFTKHLLAHIRQPGLSVEAMIKRVSAGVQQETLRQGGRRQVPFTYGSFAGEFCFAGCPGAGPDLEAEAERLRRERAAFERERAEFQRRGSAPESARPSLPAADLPQPATRTAAPEPPPVAAPRVPPKAPPPRGRVIAPPTF